MMRTARKESHLFVLAIAVAGLIAALWGCAARSGDVEKTSKLKESPASTHDGKVVTGAVTPDHAPRATAAAPVQEQGKASGSSVAQGKRTPTSSARRQAEKLQQAATDTRTTTVSPPGTGNAGDNEEPDARRPDNPLAAAYFRYQQRLSADGTVPENALMVAKAQRDAMLSSQGDSGGISSASWTWIGPGNIGGRLRAIVISPTQPNTMWVGSASGGIWKTVNGGAAWYPVDDFIPSLAVGCMAIDPANPDVLYAGTGEGFFDTPGGSSNTAAVRGAGIFKSVDGGETWFQMASTAGPGWYWVSRIAINPANSNIMLAATEAGIFRTIDGGASWSQRTTVRTLDLSFHPTDGTKVVAGRNDGIAQVSNDGGVTWLNATGLTGTRVELRYARNSPMTVYAAVSSAGRIRIYRSVDGGLTYVLRTTGSGISTYSSYNNVLWVDPTNANTLVLGGVYLFRSTDGGATLPQSFGSVHADQHVITEHPGFNGTTNRIVYFGHDGGISRADNVYTSATTNLNNNLGVTQFYGAAISPISGVVLGGTQDNGTLRYSGLVQGWTHPFGGDGGYSATDPTNANYFYGEYQWAQIFRSANGGLSGTSISQGISDAGGTNVNFIPYYMLDPNNPDRMLVCGRRLWRSDNVKTGSPPLWTIIKQSIEPPGPEPEPNKPAHFAPNSPWNIATVAVAEGNSDIVWVGYNNGQIWKTTTGTLAAPIWSRIDASEPLLPDRWVSKIAIDRSNHDRVYVCFMGWEPDNVWKTEDGGLTWARRTGSGTSALPSAPASCVSLHRTEADWVYVGTDIGIFASSDDGQTWTTSTQGPGTVPVEELTWKNDTTLMAVTHGRGIFLATVTPGVEPVSPSSFSIERGRRQSGGLQDLIFSDDLYLALLPGAVLSSAEAPVRVVMEATAPSATATELRFGLEASVNIQNIGQKIELFNYATSSYEALDQRMATTTDSVAEVVVLVNPARFIDPATRAMKARVSWKESGPVQQYPWTARADQALWRITP